MKLSSSVSRELKRNSIEDEYSERSQKCRRKKLLDNGELREKIKESFQESSWSPEQISNRLAHEERPFQISYTTIYKEI